MQILSVMTIQATINGKKKKSDTQDKCSTINRTIQSTCDGTRVPRTPEMESDF